MCENWKVALNPYAFTPRFETEMCEDRAVLNNSVFTPRSEMSIIPPNHEFSSQRNTIYSDGIRLSGYLRTRVFKNAGI